MIFGVFGAIVLIALIWLAVTFLAMAMFLGFANLVGWAWAALISGGILTLVLIIVALIAAHKIEQARRKAMVKGLASSAAINLAIGLLTKRPLMTFGLAGAAAAAFFASRGKSRT